MIIWNLWIIKGDKYIIRRDIKNGVFLLNLVVVFEEGEIEIFEVFIRKVYCYLWKEGYLEFSRFELRIINFFKEFYVVFRVELIFLYWEFWGYFNGLR